MKAIVSTGLAAMSLVLALAWASPALAENWVHMGSVKWRRLSALTGKIALLLAVLVLASCFPISQNTLPSNTRIPADQSLTGTWYSEDVMMGGYTRVDVRAIDQYRLAVKESGYDNKGNKAQVIRYTATFHKIGRLKIISALTTTRQGLSLYALSTWKRHKNGDVTLSFMTASRLEKLVRAGRARGQLGWRTTKTGERFEVLEYLTESPAGLVSLIGSLDAKYLFHEPVPLSRTRSSPKR